ncbi:MAG: hypothetical protein KBB16_03350 [Candidatus Pacebacteria bacterium]|nr:hypothetical protein [Candidatus Paceibacterota bacterium]
MFDNNYPNRKDKRRAYTGSKAFDRSCRNHGSCDWCKGQRLYRVQKEQERIEDLSSDLEEVFCIVCGSIMKPGIAMQNSFLSFSDFGQDGGQRGTTQSRVGPSAFVLVNKCTKCGHSITL